MKNVKSQTPDHNTRFNANKNRPDIRDNMDSREGEEQQSKGNDVTHNQKEVKNKKQEKKNK